MEICRLWWALGGIDEAIKAAEEHAGAGVPFEYRIENRATDEVITGFINWE
ncbi:MAG: hypothetical protein ACI4WS_03495 [Oscillospiraceae bacterium]